MPDDLEQVSLYRISDSPPFYRWTCTIEEDPANPDGYRVIARDPTFADDSFLHRLQQHMRSPVKGSYLEERPGGVTVSGMETLHPGDPGYFDTAARTVPFAHVGRAPGKE